MAEHFDIKEELKKVPTWVWLAVAAGLVVVYVIYKGGSKTSSSPGTITYSNVPLGGTSSAASPGTSVGTSTAAITPSTTTIPSTPSTPSTPWFWTQPTTTGTTPISVPPIQKKKVVVTGKTHAQEVAIASAHDLAYDQRLAARGAKTGYYPVSGKYTTTGAISKSTKTATKTVGTHPIIRTTPVSKTTVHAVGLSSTRTAIATAAKPKAMTHTQAVAAARAHDLAYNQRLMARGATSGYYPIGGYGQTMNSVAANYKTAQAKSPAPSGYKVPYIAHAKVSSAPVSHTQAVAAAAAHDLAYNQRLAARGATSGYYNIGKYAKYSAANYKTSQARGK